MVTGIPTKHANFLLQIISYGSFCHLVGTMNLIRPALKRGFKPNKGHFDPSSGIYQLEAIDGFDIHTIL